MSPQKIIVGYDGSQSAQVALQWAGAVADRRQVPLLVICATGGEGSGLGLRRERVLRMREGKARTIAKEAMDLFEGRIGVPVSAETAVGDPGEVLSSLSTEARLVVVGHRGHGSMRGILIGSVAFAVMNHSKSPVAVVRENVGSLPSPEYPIVAGVDGSSGSYRALKYAADLAADTGASLRIAVAWSEPAPELSDTVYAMDEEGHPLPGERDPWQQTDRSSFLDDLSQEILHAAKDTASLAVKHVKQSHPGLRLEAYVEEGRSEDVVLAAAHDAALIVVGARGHSVFTSLLIGSTSRSVVQSAPCAVIVVR